MASLYLYPIWVRLWHFFNALLFLVLIVTGLSLQYSGKDFCFIRFDIAVILHNIGGILLLINYLVFIIFNTFTSNGKYYRVHWKGFSDRLMKQTRFYVLGIFTGKKPPFPVTKERKFNPLQKLSYILSMYFLMPILLLTGVALIFPEIVIIDRIFGTSGIHFTDLLHIISGFILSMFMFIHIYLCFIVQPTGSSFRAMISGYHDD